MSGHHHLLPDLHEIAHEQCQLQAEAEDRELGLREKRHGDKDADIGKEIGEDRHQHELPGLAPPAPRDAAFAMPGAIA